jgi:peptide/nickel transport system permease protein
MFKFILRRVIRGILALFVFQSLLFALIHALPYDFSAFIFANVSYRAFIRRQFLLDRPLGEQYLQWMLRFIRFDLGESYQHWPTAVTELLFSRLSRTLLLFLSATVLAYLLGIWLGKMIAWRRGSLFEFVATLGGVASYTSFAPWLGFLLINVFGWYLGWLPYQRIISHTVWVGAPVRLEFLLVRMVATALLAVGAVMLIRHATRRIRSRRRRTTWRVLGFAATGLLVWGWWASSGLGYLVRDVLAHLALPLGTVVLISFSETMLIMRVSMLEIVGEKYVTLARAKGLPESVIRDRHVARNAILPVITRLMLNLPFVLVGSLAIERVFFWQALGQSVFEAVEFQDVPVLMGILSVIGGLVLILHVVLDVLYVCLDPRVRHAGGN